MPIPVEGEVLLRVLACSVCHTDLHIVEGELPPLLPHVIPGHLIQKVGLFGFGASAQLNIPVLRSWDCRVYVSTREPRHQQLAREMGAVWVGGATDVPLNLSIAL